MKYLNKTNVARNVLNVACGLKQGFIATNVIQVAFLVIQTPGIYL